MSTSTWICTDNPWHEWDGLACRWCDATRTPAEAIVSQLASRRGGSEAAAKALVDAHRAQVLAGADLLPKADVVAWLTKKARENTPIEQLASKVARGAVRPDNLRMLPATFFEAGRTYTDGTGYTAPEITTYFRVEHVTRHPDRGHLRAIGWMRTGEPDAGWHGDFRDEGEFDGWTDVTDTTQGDHT